MVAVRQPVRPRHVLGIVYGIDPVISEAPVVFFAHLDNRMSDFMTEHESAVCERGSRRT